MMASPPHRISTTAPAPPAMLLVMASAAALLLLAQHSPRPSLAFAPPSPRRRRAPPPSSPVVGAVPAARDARLEAKRKKGRVGGDESDLESWYDEINGDASPEDVFWEEMERRRLLSKSGVGEQSSSDDNGGKSPFDALDEIGVASTIASQYADDGYAAGRNPSGGGGGGAAATSMIAIADEKSADAALAAFSAYAVSDNYLYDDDDEDGRRPGWMMRNDPSLWEGEDGTLAEEDAELNRQLDELERELMGDGVDGSVVGGSSPYFDPTMSDEPWDRYGQSRRVDSEEEEEDDGDDDGDAEDDVDDGNNDDDDEGNDDGVKGKSVFHKELKRKMDIVSQSAREFMLDYDEEHPEEAEAEARLEEEEYARSLSSIGITSPRLENAAVNPRAAAYFRRPPDERQGYDAMWASAIDTPCVKNLYGIFCNYGVQFADNFDDWDEGSGSDGDGFRSIEDVASYKARRVHEVTGLPSVASRTSFEVEPIRPEDMDKANDVAGGGGGGAAAGGGGGGKKARQVQKSPRVVAGYRFNNIGEHVDRVVQALLPFSEPTRVTRFRSCVCYYDGDLELFEYGELDCDLYFAGSMRTFLPMSSAINSMIKSLELALDLQFQKWLRAKVNDATGGGAYSDASLKLRDRVLKEAKLLPNDIIDVSSFMDACVDVNLMDQCGKELADRFVSAKPSKILTIATTGLVIAIRKSRRSLSSKMKRFINAISPE
jgi:hypothetical protein